MCNIESVLYMSCIKPQAYRNRHVECMTIHRSNKGN